jgi:hypothetical protein
MECRAWAHGPAPAAPAQACFLKGACILRAGGRGARAPLEARFFWVPYEKKKGQPFGMTEVNATRDGLGFGVWFGV